MNSAPQPMDQSELLLREAGGVPEVMDAILQRERAIDDILSVGGLSGVSQDDPEREQLHTAYQIVEARKHQYGVAEPSPKPLITE